MEASENNFQLPPFPAFPCATRYVPLGTVHDAVQRVSRSISSHDGISLVIGPPGTGKSLIASLLTQQFSESHDVVVLGDAPIADAAAFQRHLLHHLGVDLSAVVDGDLHLALIDRVCDEGAAKDGLLIIIDESQALSPEILEAVRMATNIMRDGEPRVNAVLCGGVKLDETLTAPALEPFTQRVSTRCYVHPLNAQETRDYIHGAITACGADADQTITDEAIGAIHHACSGVPRLINQLMTEAIDCAADADQEHICENIIDRAWAQLQQLPSPMIEEPKIAHNVAPVEFGSLSVSEHQSSSSSPEPVTPADDEAIEERTDDPSVEWINESDEIAVQTEALHEVGEAAPLPSKLFGDFEHEESLSLGAGIATSHTVTSEDPAVELESMIHSQIVSLSETATEARFGGIDTEQQEGNHSQQVVWYDHPADQEECLITDEDGADCVFDDSDLLIIEDEVDVTSRPSSARVDGAEQPVSVDYRTMLNRMRQNS